MFACIRTHLTYTHSYTHLYNFILYLLPYIQYLVRALSKHGAIDAFLSSLVFVLATLSDAITESKSVTSSIEDKNSEIEAKNDFTEVEVEVDEEKESSLSAEVEVEGETDLEVPMLSRSGRCALHALPYMLLLLRKLVQRDSYLKSPITASMTDLIDDIGQFQMHELLYKMFHSISETLLPIVRSKLLNQLPSELQQEWFAIIGDLVISLQAPLPQALSVIPPQGSGSQYSQVYFYSVNFFLIILFSVILFCFILFFILIFFLIAFL